MPFGSSPAEPSDQSSLAHERRMFSLIRWKLAALNVAVLLIILVVLESGVYMILSRSIYERVDSTLLSRADQVIRSGQVRDPVRTMTFPARTAALAAEGLFYLVMDEKGLVIINPQSVPIEELSADRAPLDAAMSEGPDLRTVYLADGQRIRLYTVAVRTDTGRVAASCRLAGPWSRKSMRSAWSSCFSWPPACWAYSWQPRADSFWPSAPSSPSAWPSAGSRTSSRTPRTSCALR